MSSEEDLRDCQRAASLSEEMVHAIAPGVMAVFRAAAEAEEPPHVQLAAMEMTIAEMFRQLACTFAPAGSETGMVVRMVTNVSRPCLETDWPVYRQSFDDAAQDLQNGRPQRVSQ